MNKVRVLFLCIHNSARSQIAEAYLKQFGNDKFQVESAGLEPGVLNPWAVEVMREDGIDISQNQTNDVFEFYKAGKLFHYVVTVCDEEASERCPTFPGLLKKVNWSFADPSKFKGNYEEKLAATRIIRDQIKSAVQDFIKEATYVHEE